MLKLPVEHTVVLEVSINTGLRGLLVGHLT